jgi:hypothetical protein
VRGVSKTPSIRKLNIDTADQCVQASELGDSLSEILTAMRYERAAGALRAQRRLRDALPCLDRRGARAQRFYATIPPAYQMHDQTEFPISPAAYDPEARWVGRTRGRLDIE